MLGNLVQRRLNWWLYHHPRRLPDAPIHSPGERRHWGGSGEGPVQATEIQGRREKQEPSQGGADEAEAHQGKTDANQGGAEEAESYQG